MRRIDFSNIGELFLFHPTQEGHKVLVDKARSGRTIFLMNEEGTAYLSYDSIFGGKYAGHIHSLPECRGRELWDFAYDTAVWMVEYAELKQLLCFVKSDDRCLRLFVKQFKMPMVGAIDGENIYAVDDKTITRFKEVELCQQQ